jgi:hypothetical protein
MDHRRSGLLYARFDTADCWVNLAGDYDYLTDGYYVSMELEMDGGLNVHPTPMEVLDAYVTPIFLEKAKRAGLDIPQWYITNDYFDPPVLIDSLNPFMSRQKLVHSAAQQEKVAKSLTRNFTYAICCQELPAGASVRSFKSVLGWCEQPRYREAARRIWEVFGIPLGLVRTIEPRSGPVLLSGIWPLRPGTLNPRERAWIEEHVTWPA